MKKAKREYLYWLQNRYEKALDWWVQRVDDFGGWVGVIEMPGCRHLVYKITTEGNKGYSNHKLAEQACKEKANKMNIVLYGIHYVIDENGDSISPPLPSLYYSQFLKD